MFGDHTRNVKYIDFEFVIGADGTKFHKILSCNSEYIYYWMLYATETLRNRGYARHYTLLKECFISLPPLQEQVRIVSKIKAILPLVEKYGCEESKRVLSTLHFRIYSKNLFYRKQSKENSFHKILLMSQLPFFWNVFVRRSKS